MESKRYAGATLFADRYEVTFCTCSPDHPITPQLALDIGKRLVAEHPDLFREVRWCSASQSGYDVRLHEDVHALADPDQLCPVTFHPWSDGNEDECGQIRCIGFPRTPRDDLHFDADATAAFLADATAPASFNPYADSIASGVIAKLYDDDGALLVQCAWARMRYGISAEMAAAFAHVLTVCGLIVVTTSGFDCELSTGELLCVAAADTEFVKASRATVRHIQDSQVAHRDMQRKAPALAAWMAQLEREAAVARASRERAQCT